MRMFLIAALALAGAGAALSPAPAVAASSLPAWTAETGVIPAQYYERERRREWRERQERRRRAEWRRRHGLGGYYR